MRLTILFIFATISSLQALSDVEVSIKWEEFKEKFQKSYKSNLESRKRLSIFKENLEKYTDHNLQYKQGQVSFRKGINRFTDWTEEEFVSFVDRGLLNRSTLNEAKAFVKISGITLPSSIDWREKGAVTTVKDQGSCGSCWAFSTTGGLEGQLKISKGKVVSLSEQNLIDCSWVQGNDGCSGGLMTSALDFVQEFGIESEADYPYDGNNGNCRYNQSKVVTTIQSYVKIKKGSEKDLQKAIATIGPVSVAMDATFQLQGYESGILDDLFCTTYQLNHGVLVVGYGIENGTEYYTVKNSWGDSWGENGYFRIVRNKENQCGIATMASYPLV